MRKGLTVLVGQDLGTILAWGELGVTLELNGERGCLPYWAIKPVVTGFESSEGAKVEQIQGVDFTPQPATVKVLQSTATVSYREG